MVDWDGLENRCALTGTVGSNPTLSAIPHAFPPDEGLRPVAREARGG